MVSSYCLISESFVQNSMYKGVMELANTIGSSVKLLTETGVIELEAVITSF
jgi:hypothetical protein